MRIAPTATGGKGLLLLTLLLFAYFATGYSNPFFLVIAFSIALGSFGVALAWRNLCGVSIEVLAVPMAPAGATRPVRLRIRTRGRAFDLGIDWIGAAGRSRLLHIPMVSGTLEVDALLPALPRGVLPLANLQVTSRFPFGFVRMSCPCRTSHAVVTHPSPLPGPDRVHRGAGHRGPAASGGRGNSIAGLRAFRAGDSLGDVHWRATARRGAPVAKEREPEAGGTLVLVIDRRGDCAALELALGHACHLVLAARAQGQPLRLCSQGTDLGGAQPPSNEVLHWLATAQPLPATAAPPATPVGALVLPAPPQVPA